MTIIMYKLDAPLHDLDGIGIIGCGVSNNNDNDYKMKQMDAKTLKLQCMMYNRL